MSSTARDLEKEPQVPIRWFRPFLSSAHLDLQSTPVSPSNSDADKWVALAESESTACEAIWEALSEEEKEEAQRDPAIPPTTSDAETSSQASDTRSSKSGTSKVKVEKAIVIEDREASIENVGVGIGKEKLFEVDVRRLRLIPIYWKYTGPIMRARRITWLYDESHPVSDELSLELEDAYKHVEPWRATYQDELGTARKLGPEGYDKLRQDVTDKGKHFHVLFENDSTARLISTRSTSRMALTLLSPFRNAASPYPLPTGVIVYRGYQKAVQSTETPKAPPVRPPLLSEESYLVDESVEVKGKVRSNSIGMGDEMTTEVTDLVLAIHGIGQGLTASYEAFNFLYATNLIRQVAEKQSMHPAISSVMRSRRVQFLPVLWRANLKLVSDEEEERREREEEAHGNRYALEDIILNNKIPFVRDVMNSVLIDVPYFMSHHRENMIESVCSQSNKIYRLWCARHPGFERQGRVHLIAHSLGSALAAHILSAQPTLYPPLSSMSIEQITDVKDHFLFNTSSLFMIGSPVGVFLHLQQAQVIARKGRERTMNSPADEALDRQGVFGCLAVDSLYNIFNASDPIAYRLNPTVDSKLGLSRRPSAIPSINATVLSSISRRVTTLFGGTFSSSSPPSSPDQKRSRSRSSSRPRNGGGEMERMASEFELGASDGSGKKGGTRAERRFLALNPHGTLDFYLPAEGSISDYLDMLSAHSSYWSDPNLAAFILSEICARKEDLMRTGLGPRKWSKPDAEM